jgi:hypothetical protein
MTKPQFALRAMRAGFCAAIICAAAVSATTVSAQQPPAAPQGQPAMQQLYVGRDPSTFKNGRLYSIWPSQVDPEIKRFDKPNLILTKNGLARTADLLVFFPGTTADPNSAWPFLETGANAGYRVIGLMYDNGNSVPQLCGPNPDPACSDRFREKRNFGDGASNEIDDLPGESVVSRLTKLLQYLVKYFPDEGWGQYLANGQPNWARIVVSGHSQGGGIAAYIAKKEKVARVVVLSGAADRVDATKVWAPWVTSPSATPLDRWYAGYHQKETRAEAMKAAYAVIGIPPAHIRAFTLEPNPAAKTPPGADTYHMSMSGEEITPRDANGQPAFAPDWAFLLGTQK